jgi:hypothetical protein
VAETATLTVPGLQGIADIPPALIFRGTTEARRQEIGAAWQKLAGIAPNGGMGDFELSLPDVDINLMGILEVQAQDLKLSFTQQPEQTWRIQGRVKVPPLFNATADFAGDHYIALHETDWSWDVVGSLSVSDVQIVPGVWGIQSAILSFDTTQGIVEGDATVLIPTGIAVSGGVRLLNGQLDRISLDADNLNLAIGTTGAFLQEIGGYLDHLADSLPVEFGGNIGATAGPQITVHLPSWAGGDFSGSLIQLDVEGGIDVNHLTAAGTLEIIGGLATGTGSAELNWQDGFLAANAHFDYLSGWIVTDANFRATSNMDVTMTGTAGIIIPDESWVFAPLRGLEIASGNMMFQYSNNEVMTDDFLAAWASLTLPILGNVSGGFSIPLDGSAPQYIGGKEIAGLINGEESGGSATMSGAGFFLTTDFIPPDFMEPNDSSSQASDLGEMDGLRVWPNLSIHSPYNDDWYRIELLAEGTEEDFVQIDFDHTLGDLDIFLQDASGQLIDYSLGVTNTECISLEGLPTGTYLIRVTGAGGDTNPEYMLTIHAPENPFQPDITETFTIETARPMCFSAPSGMKPHPMQSFNCGRRTARCMTRPPLPQTII